jgi:hypothetical protein
MIGLETARRFSSVLPRCIQQAVEARRHERKQEEQRRQKEAERKQEEQRRQKEAERKKLRLKALL